MTSTKQNNNSITSMLDRVRNPYINDVKKIKSILATEICRVYIKIPTKQRNKKYMHKHESIFQITPDQLTQQEEY